MKIMPTRIHKTEGIVLKYRNYGEADRIITLFTKHYGKITGLAKGVRRLKSKRAGSLEPASHIVLMLARGNGLDVITQVSLLNSFSTLRQNLERITQMYQILEIVDALTAERQEHELVYEGLTNLLLSLNHDHDSKRQAIVSTTKGILENLGFGSPEENSEFALKHHLENIIERELRSKKMLSV